MTEESMLLHYKAKYVIVVEKHSNGCLVTYPANYFIEPNIPIIKEKYSFIDNKLVIESIDGEREIQTYGYDNRLLIMTNLFLKAEKLGLSKKLIIYFDGLKRKSGLLSILPDMQEEFLLKEQILKDNYLEIKERLYFPADAEKEGILDGFNNITNLIVKGEL